MPSGYTAWYTAWYTALPPAPPPAAKPADDVDAHGTVPVPSPLRDGDQAIGVAATHDSGGSGKHPHIVLGAHPAPADLRPGGVAPGHTVSSTGRNAALPTTSPD
jgi:hypothetical protein